jgi:F0F1-type ATP synthase membrane subunit b/b'
MEYRQTQKTPPGPRTPQGGEGSLDRVGSIIDEAQQSARRLVDEARRQSELLLDQARRDAERRRGDMLEKAKVRIDELITSSEQMLAGVDKMSAELRGITNGLRETSEKLRAHVADQLDTDGKRRRLGSRH